MKNTLTKNQFKHQQLQVLQPKKVERKQQKQQMQQKNKKKPPSPPVVEEEEEEERDDEDDEESSRMTSSYTGDNGASSSISSSTSTGVFDKSTRKKRFPIKRGSKKNRRHKKSQGDGIITGGAINKYSKKHDNNAPGSPNGSSATYSSRNNQHYGVNSSSIPANK
jgi:hypothetical protein